MTRLFNKFVVVLLTAVIGSAACGRSSNPTAATTTITPTVSSVTVTSGSRTASTIQLAASARMADGTVRDVTNLAAWQSSNAALATVSSAGVVTFFGSGDVDVRATYQSVSGTLHLVVATVPVIAITISGAPSSPATSFQLTASARLADGSTQDVTRSATWESSNTSVATVTGGLVSVMSNGEAEIRATYQGTTGATHIAVARPTGFTLTGFVTDAVTTQPIPGVRVQLIGSGSSQTDEHGAFGVAVSEGRALVEFSKTGYQTIEKDVTINGDTQMLVTLTPLPKSSNQ
jgi:CarboxypepD_reg-like domain/Bacterial Ig-like domain (group 2)